MLNEQNEYKSCLLMRRSLMAFNLKEERMPMFSGLVVMFNIKYYGSKPDLGYSLVFHLLLQLNDSCSSTTVSYYAALLVVVVLGLPHRIIVRRYY